MNISTISTYTDWATRTGAAGLLGIERIFDWLKVAKIQTVYWRAFNGGNACYPSRVASIQLGANLPHVKIGDGGGPLSYKHFKHFDFREFDPLAEAVRIGHERGIQVHAWFTCCEEDHGGAHMSAFGGQKRFRKQDRTGKDYPGTLDFFFPEVRDYKLKLLDELLERNVDGVLLDFVRSNATPNGDADGVHRFGYNTEIRAAFAEQHGVDPLELPKDDERWLKFKCDYIGGLVRAMKSRLGERPLSIMAIPHINNPRWMCLDLPALTHEGTVEAVMGFSLSYDYGAERVAADFRQLRDQVKGSARTIAGVQAYHGITPGAFDAAIAAAEDAGAEDLVLYEAEALIADPLLTSVRATHLGASRRTRDVAVQGVAAAPTEGDWNAARSYTGFFLSEGADRELPTAQTSFSILRGPDALHVRIVAEGEQGAPDPEFVATKKVYIDWLRATQYWLFADRSHVFVDVGASRLDFAHFLVDRDGTRLQGKRSDGGWEAPWQGRVVQVSPRRWEAFFEIPFASLGRTPVTGERWGFQIVREQAAVREVSTWCVTTGRGGITPAHWSDLVFE